MRKPEALANLALPANLELDSATPVAHAESHSVYACRGRLSGAAIGCYLKVADRGHRSLANEREALEYVRARGIRAPTVLAAFDERDPPSLLLSELRGVMLWDLIDPRRARGDRESVLLYLRTYGATLAEIHAIHPTNWAAHPRANLESITSLDSSADRRQARIIEWLAAGRPSQIQPSFVHGDFNTANVLIDGDAAGVIDWEFAGRGWKEYEIAWALRARLHFLNTPEERSAILSGYSSLGSFDADQLRWCEVLNYLQFAQWTLDTNSRYSEFALARAEHARDRERDAWGG